MSAQLFTLSQQHQALAQQNQALQQQNAALQANTASLDQQLRQQQADREDEVSCLLPSVFITPIDPLNDNL